MRWYCPYCGLKWSYPIEYCVNCGKRSKIKKSSKYIVIGFTKINIPSPRNERVPYYIALMEGDNGDRIIKKTFTEPKIGTELRVMVSSGKTIVSISKVKYDIYESISKVLNSVGGIRINRSSKILIKPNLSFPARPTSGVVTNPLVVEGVIEYLLKNGVNKENILIGDSCAIGFDIGKAVEKSGIREVCDKKSIEFVDLENGNTVTKKLEVAGESFQLEFAEEVFRRDIIINVPVVKTHLQAGVSIALKNMKGCVKNKSKKFMHKYGLQKAIAYMNLLLPKYITVADGTVGLEGIGPSVLGKPADLCLILASKDPVALDFVACKLFGLEPTEYMLLASKIGLGNKNLNEINIVGEETQVVSRKFELPNQKFSPNQKIQVFDGRGCSGCSNNLWLALNHLSNDSKGPDLEAIFGNHFNSNQLDKTKSKLAIGNCAIDRMHRLNLNSHEISGCPPSVNDIVEKISKFKAILSNDKEDLSLLSDKRAT